MKLLICLLALATPLTLLAQDPAPKKKKKSPPPFSWVSPVSESTKLISGLQHGTFESPSMGIDVGYYIYLPPTYEKTDTRFPVVYHLHGGRPGSEKKSIKLATFIDQAIAEEKIAPTIYVFPNGGPMSWYDMPDRENAMGETVFVEELIPHIDETYRTTGSAAARGIEGFSQGGRGTTRIMFKHPQLFSSAAPGGSGYEPEKRIQENDGYESDNVRFLPIGYNTWDLAKTFATAVDRPDLPIMLWVGTKGFNYEYNLKFSDYLKELSVDHQMLITEGVAHSATGIYEKRGLELMQFHQEHFAPATKN